MTGAQSNSEVDTDQWEMYSYISEKEKGGSFCDYRFQASRRGEHSVWMCVCVCVCVRVCVCERVGVLVHPW